MASCKLLALILILVCCFAPCLHARKLLSEEITKNVPSLDAGLFLSVLPKGNVPPSAPSKKGHAVIDEQKLLTMHFAKIDRILKSVPSPGMGH
ncbi:precursor of CEP14-like [Aristolochia californica]|uniref:precursor of CEP14-like n=1 Tax=Aristolochia californica TaxID=171875 RepID=UPI0035D8F737